MKKVQVQIDFKGLRDADLGNRGAAVVTSMTGNPHFPELAAELALVQAAHVSFAQAMADAAGGGKALTARKEESRLALEAALHDLGIRINLKAKGNAAVLETTGFPLVGGTARRSAAAKDLPVMVGGMKFTRYAHTGNIRARVERADAALAYKWQYTEAPVTEDSQWITVEVATSSWLFTGLTIGKFYAFRVAGLGKVPGLVWSDPEVVLAT